MKFSPFCLSASVASVEIMMVLLFSDDDDDQVGCFVPCSVVLQLYQSDKRMIGRLCKKDYTLQVHVILLKVFKQRSKNYF